MPFLPFYPLQTILLNDLVGCDSPLQIVMAFRRTIIVSRGLSNQTQKVLIQTKRAPHCHYYLQRAVTVSPRVTVRVVVVGGGGYCGEKFWRERTRSSSEHLSYLVKASNAL